MRIKIRQLTRVRFAWVLALSLFYMLNLDQFGMASGLGPEPKYWSAGFFLGTALLFLPRLRLGQFLRKPLFWWVIGYLFASILSLGLATDFEFAQEGIVLVVTTCLYVSIALLAYPQLPPADRLWLMILWLALVLAVASIAQEYFNPAAYIFAESGRGIAGRAAGFYLNPNIAAQAIVVILACLMSRSRAGASLIAVSIALLGLLLTFSRGGLVCWAALVIAATVRGRLPRWFLIVIVCSAAVILVAGSTIFDFLATWVSPENHNSLDRLAWLLGQGGLDDYSAGEREYLASYAWQEFTDAPLLGHGLGYIWVWDAGLGTHNLMLRHLLEYGVLGITILPLLLIASIKSGPDTTDRKWAWLVAGIIVLMSLFTHNLLERGSFLFPWLLLNLVVRSDQNAATR